MNTIVYPQPTTPTEGEQIIEKKILDMICKAYEDEVSDIDYCNRLINKVKSPEDKEILRQIRLDEEKHAYLFKRICYHFYTTNPKEPEDKKILSPNVVRDFEQSIFRKLDSVEFYRKIYFALFEVEIRDILYEIITDEQCHATKFTYLYSKYRL